METSGFTGPSVVMIPGSLRREAGAQVNVATNLTFSRHDSRKLEAGGVWHLLPRLRFLQSS